jgi:hypothetical protein
MWLWKAICSANCYYYQTKIASSIGGPLVNKPGYFSSLWTDLSFNKKFQNILDSIFKLVVLYATADDVLLNQYSKLNIWNPDSTFPLIFIKFHLSLNVCRNFSYGQSVKKTHSKREDHFKNMFNHQQMSPNIIKHISFKHVLMGHV